MVDLQKLCSLVIGYSLGGLLFGKPLSNDEILCSKWLSNKIFSSGIDNKDIEIESLVELSYFAISETPEPILATLDKLPSHLQSLCRLALNIPCQYDEACAVRRNSSSDKNVFFDKLMESAEAESWEMEDEKRILDITTRCLLTTLLKHTGMLQKLPSDPAVKEIFNVVLNWRNKLINKVCNANCKDAEEYSYDEKDQDTTNNTLNESNVIDPNGEFNLKTFSQEILQRCLFLLIFVKGKFIWFCQYLEWLQIFCSIEKI